MRKLVGSLLVVSIFLVSCSDGVWLGAEKKLDLKGEREKVIQLSSDLQLDSSLSGKVFPMPNSVKNTGWYKSSGITSALVSNLYVQEPLTRDELFSIASESDFLIGATPIIAKGKIFAMGVNGIIKSYDIASKSIEWENDYFANATKKGLFDTFSGKYLSGGLSFADGVVYGTAGLGVVVAINSNTGEVLWSAKLSSPSRSTPIKTSKGMVIIQTADNKTFALNEKNGAIIWTHIGVGEEISSLRTSAPVANDNAIIVQYSSGELYALSHDLGEEIWVESLASPLDVVVTDSHLHTVITSPTLDGNYVLAYGHDGAMGVFDIHNGKALWKKQLGIDKQFWVAGDLIFAVTINSQLIAVSKKDGGVKWLVNLNSLLKDDEKADWSSPMIINNLVVLVNTLGKMMIFDPNTGNNSGQVEIDKDVYLSPIVANGEMYTLSNNGEVTQY